jgi:hypothetical protein
MMKIRELSAVAVARLLVNAGAVLFLLHFTSFAVEVNISRPDSSVFHGTFQGFGAEWDPFYWNQNNLNRGTDSAGWELITGRIKDLRMGIARMMMQLSWCQSSQDLTQWTWDNQQMKSVFRYLDFFQSNNIDVILTDWGWSVWGLYDSPTDFRFAQGVAAYLKEFMENRGYTCIKYLVIGNEPDNEIQRNHGMDAYVTMYENVDQALRDAGLRSKLKLTGPDMGGQWDFMRDGIDRLKGILDCYDFHRYSSFEETSNIGIAGDWETLWNRLDMWRTEVLNRDTDGGSKPILITEFGGLGGGTNSHPLIDTYAYALHMADYATTILKTRIQAGSAWCMHDTYYFGGDQFMRWGMWGYLDEGWGLRPWSQSYGLMVSHAPRGSVPAAVNGTPPQTPEASPYRFSAVRRPDGGWSVFLVNRTDSEVNADISLPETPENNLERYVCDRSTFINNPNAIALPPVDTLNTAQSFSITLPESSLTVLAEISENVAGLKGQAEQEHDYNVRIMGDVLEINLPQSMDVRIDVTDAQGRHLDMLFHKKLDQGTNHIAWSNKLKQSGFFIFVITAGRFQKSIKSCRFDFN